MASEHNTNDDSQDQDQPDEKPYVRMKREDIQALEAAAARAKDMDVVQRELMMTKAGIDTDTPMGKMFFKAYEGDLTKEAIATAAQEIGIIERQTQQQQIPSEEKDSTKERQTLNNGATPPGDNPTHPKDLAKANAKKVLDEGGKFEQAAGAFLTTLVQAHAAGDARATRSSRDRFDTQ